MTYDKGLFALLFSLEEQLLDPAVRKDPAAVAALLADDFEEFGSSGRIFNKQQIMADLLLEDSSSTAKLSHFAMKQLNADAVLVTYRTSISTGDGRIKSSLRSSIWIKYKGHWKILFHQGTIAAAL